MDGICRLPSSAIRKLLLLLPASSVCRATLEKLSSPSLAFPGAKNGVVVSRSQSRIPQAVKVPLEDTKVFRGPNTGSSKSLKVSIESTDVFRGPNIRSPKAFGVLIEDPSGFLGPNRGPNVCRCINLGSQSLSRSHKKKGIQSYLASWLILPLSFAYLLFTFDVSFSLLPQSATFFFLFSGAFVEQCLTNCSRHHQIFPKQKFGVLLSKYESRIPKGCQGPNWGYQNLLRSQSRIPNHWTEIWGPIKRNGSKASHLASLLIPQISRSFPFWVYLFMTFLVFYFHPLSKLLSFSQLTPFSYFHPLSSEICEQL